MYMNHLAEDHSEEDRPRGPAAQGGGGSREVEIQSEAKAAEGEGQRPRQKPTQVRKHVMIVMVGVSLLGPWGTQGSLDAVFDPTFAGVHDTGQSAAKLDNGLYCHEQ